MTWAMFYLVCFLVGVTLSVLSFLGGTLAPAARACSRAARAVAHGGHLATARRDMPAAGSEMPFFNFATITAFLAWFGGTGYC